MKKQYESKQQARGVSVMVAVLLMAMATFATASDKPQPEALEATNRARNERMQWWRDAKFGMFIHFGIYAIPAGEWKGKNIRGHAEWIVSELPEEEKANYFDLRHQFNPKQYDPERWVTLAKQAGMKYVVITTKHHDGFALFDSAVTDYDIGDTPYRRDMLAPLAQACRAQNLEVGWYYSIMDWHHPDAKGERFGEYVKYMSRQLEELLTNYGKIGVLWFDGEWIGEWRAEMGVQLEKHLRKIQPQVIINNRIGKRMRAPGDYATPEQKIPKAQPDWDWETCMTMNSSWGFRKGDHKWKSTKTLIRMLVDVVSKGGNFLLNVGPTAEGVIPEPSVERLTEIGDWMRRNGESIYGTTASPLRQQPTWGRCTHKQGRLYLHVFDWPDDGKLIVPLLASDVTSATVLGEEAATPLSVTRDIRDTIVAVPKQAPAPIDTVIELVIDGEIALTSPGQQAADGSVGLDAWFADTHGKTIRIGTADGIPNIGWWTDPADSVSWDMEIHTPGEFEVMLTMSCTEPAGSPFVLTVADQELTGTVSPTGDWQTYERTVLGNVHLDGGSHTLAVKATDLVGEGVMNLRSVFLKPMATRD